MRSGKHAEALKWPSPTTIEPGTLGCKLIKVWVDWIHLYYTMQICVHRSSSTYSCKLEWGHLASRWAGNGRWKHPWACIRRGMWTSHFHQSWMNQSWPFHSWVELAWCTRLLHSSTENQGRPRFWIWRYRDSRAEPCQIKKIQHNPERQDVL